MRRVSRTVCGVLASASLLGGFGTAALTAATIVPTGAVAAITVPNPTAVEYGATAIEY